MNLALLFVMFALVVASLGLGYVCAKIIEVFS